MLLGFNKIFKKFSRFDIYIAINSSKWLCIVLSYICVKLHFLNEAPVITSFYNYAVLTHRCYWGLVIISVMSSLTVINLRGGHVIQFWFRRHTGFLLQAPKCHSPGLMPVGFSPARFSPALTSSSDLVTLLWLMDMHPHLYLLYLSHSSKIAVCSCYCHSRMVHEANGVEGQGSSQTSVRLRGVWAADFLQQGLLLWSLFVCLFFTIEKGELFPLPSIKNIVYFYSNFPHYILLSWGGHGHCWDLVSSWVGDAFN